MQEMSYWDVMEEKHKRQKAIKEIEYHAGGNCVHIGKISPGCRDCFTGDLEKGGGIQVGSKCMAKCPMCYYPADRPEETHESVCNKLADWFYYSNVNNAPVISMSFQSSGETLLYTDELSNFAVLFQKMNRERDITTYHHLYTNGILANEEMLKTLQTMGIHELRFHVTASKYTNSPAKNKKKVFENMYQAAKMGFTVTVEEPSYPKNKADIFEILPILADCGGKHLDMVENQLTVDNIKALKQQSNFRYYKDYFYHMYDEGLVYDVMEEVIAKGYGYSVLDCNSGVERCRHGKTQNVLFDMKSIDGMCDDFDYFSYKHPTDFYKENLLK